MASGGGDPADNSGQTNSFKPNKLTCAICLETYRRPKLLPCFHTFCQSCIQVIAGTSATFPCPACRATVLVPPGGVGAMANNFYVEQELNLSATPATRLCDVCTEDRDATHSCIQCQQRYCLPCRRFHDSISSTRGHTVVPLTSDSNAEGACGGHDSADAAAVETKEERCPKHPDQRLVLRCTPCSQSICVQCKLTRHEGHPTEDLTDTGERARTRLQSALQDLTLQMQRVDNVVSALHNQEGGLQKEKAAAEGVMRERRDVLVSWANQSYCEAVQSLQAAADQNAASLKDRAEKAQNVRAALQAKHDHIRCVLNDDNVADLVALETQLAEEEGASSENGRVREMEKEVAPALEISHDHAAVHQSQMRMFVGVVENDDAAAWTSILSTATAAIGCYKSYCFSYCFNTRATASELPVSDMGVKTQGGSAHESAQSGSDTPPARKTQPPRRKRPPRELVYAELDKKKSSYSLYIGSMCLISKDRLWIRYLESYFDGYSTIKKRFMKLMNGNGVTLELIKNDSSKYLHDENNLVCIFDDIIYSKSGSTRLEMLEPGAERKSAFPIDFSVQHMFRSAACGKLIVLQPKENTSGDIISVHFTSKLPLEWTTRCLLKKNNIGTLCDVSQYEQYLAFIDSSCGLPVVYMRTWQGNLAYLNYFCSYNFNASFSKHQSHSMKFCLIDWKEFLLVSVPKDNKIHVVDHTDGCRLVRYLDTGKITLPNPPDEGYRMVTDYDQRVWIGCDDGKVVLVDL